MAESSAWMPLYVGDYLRDTGHLSAAEHGAYLLLIMQAWTRDGSLPTDLERLRTMCRLDREEWEAIRGAVLPFFYVRDGCYRHRRIDHELNEASSHILQRRAAGKASAASRKRQREANGKATGGQREVNEKSTSVATGRSTEGPTGSQRNGNPSPSPSPVQDSVLRTAAPGAAPKDVRTILWQQGLPIVRSLIGQSETQTRAFLGKMLKEAQDDCARVLRVVLEAQSLVPADPSAWLMKAASQERSLLDPDAPAYTGGF